MIATAKETCGIWNCTDDEYHGNHARIGKSMLDVFRASPRRFHALFVAQTMAKPDPTPALEFGKLFHQYVLECDRYLSECFVPPQLAPDGTAWDRRKKEHKEWWAEVEADARKPVSLETNQLLVDMRFAIQNNEKAAHLLFGDDGPTEQALWWTDEETGLTLKCRRDKVARSGWLIVDLKTCTDSTPEAFARDAAKYGYHRQAAMYLDGHAAVFNEDAKGMVFICVDKNPPHDVGAYVLDVDAIDLGRKENREALNRLAQCMATDDWTAEYQRLIRLVSLPRYAFLKNEYEV